MEPEQIEQPGMRQKAAKGWFIAFWAVFLPGIVVSAIMALKLVTSDASEPLFPEILLSAIPGFVVAVGAYFIYRGLRLGSMAAKVLLVLSAGAVYWYAINAILLLIESTGSAY